MFPAWQEMKKLKELMSATERVRREKWINEKTRKIKEITVRGEHRRPRSWSEADEPHGPEARDGSVFEQGQWWFQS